MSYCYLQFFQKKSTNQFDLTTYYDTSSRVVSIHSLEEFKTPKRRFEINWRSLVFTNRITREMEEEYTHALYQL